MKIILIKNLDSIAKYRYDGNINENGSQNINRVLCSVYILRVS